MPDAASVILQIDDREALKTLARIDAKAISQFERNGYKLNLKASSLPLGRITGDFDKFSASIEAAASRVLAFTATTTAVYGLATAINRLFTDSIKLEKQLSIIQSILQTSPSNLQKFSSALFDIANKTGQAFDVAANAASEFARQGLSIEDTLAATSAALAFSKIAAVDAGQAVENLTSTLNTFNNEALSYTDIIDTITTLDNNFAISAAGIADGLKRIGSVASESGIQLKEIASLLSVVQQVSARGAPVIANGLKTIFTRLNRQSVQDTLSSIGVASRDSNGEFRNSIDILRDLANQFDNLSDSQRAYISEQVAGVYQINTLQSAIKALRGEFALYDKALSGTEDSSGSAERRLQILTQTTDSALTKLKNNLFQFFAETGKITLKPIADSFITFTSDQILGSLVNALKSSSGELEKQSSATGASIGDFLIGGIQSVISGPGLVILAASIGKLLTILTSDILKGISVLSGLKKVSITDSDQQKAVNKAIKEGNSLLVERLRTSRDIVERVNILNNLLDTSNRKQQLLTANKMINFGISSVFPKKTNSSGFIPNFENRAGEILEKKGAQEHGYKAGRVYKTRVHDGNGKSSISFVNSAEKIINFTNGKGKKATLVVPPNGFGKGTQIAKNNSNGFVPNFVSASRLIGKGREGSFYRLTKNLGLKRFQKQESKEKTIEAAEKEFLISKLLADISIPGVAAPEIPDTLDRVRRTQSIRKKIVKDDLAVHAVGKKTSAAFSEILEEEMYSRGLWMSDLHGYNYTLNAKGKKFIQENKDYFKNGAGFNTPEEYFDAFARAGGKATIIDAGYAEPQTSELKKRIKSYTQFSNGFIPNFQSKNKQFSIARGLRESTLDYSRGNRGIKIGFMRGIERGDAFMMFRKLVELSARSGQPISSDSLEWQVKKEKEILQAQREGKSKYDLLKILIPQLRYREIEGLETSGRITEFPEGFGKPKISEFSSLKDLEKISKGINPKAILNKGILVEDVESRFTGSKEELIKQNRQLQSSRGIRMKLKGRKASGFVPNFASLKKRLLIDRGSYSQNSSLRYSRDNDKIHFDFVRSNRDGDARDLVAKLLEISSRAGSRTIDIGPLLPQPTLFEAGKRRGYSGFKLLKTTFPQLKIAKAVEGITASGRLIGYKNGSMATFDFNSLQELEQFANQLDEVNEATMIGGLSMKFTGNQEELRKRNRENAYNRRLRNEPIKIKRDFSKGFIPNFNIVKKVGAEKIEARFKKYYELGKDYAGFYQVVNQEAKKANIADEDIEIFAGITSALSPRVPDYKAARWAPIVFEKFFRTRSTNVDDYLDLTMEDKTLKGDLGLFGKKGEIANSGSPRERDDLRRMQLEKALKNLPLASSIYHKTSQYKRGILGNKNAFAVDANVLASILPEANGKNLSVEELKSLIALARKFSRSNKLEYGATGLQAAIFKAQSKYKDKYSIESAEKIFSGLSSSNYSARGSIPNFGDLSGLIIGGKGPNYFLTSWYDSLKTVKDISSPISGGLQYPKKFADRSYAGTTDKGLLELQKIYDQAQKQGGEVFYAPNFPYSALDKYGTLTRKINPNTGKETNTAGMNMRNIFFLQQVVSRNKRLFPRSLAAKILSIQPANASLIETGILYEQARNSLLSKGLSSVAVGKIFREGSSGLHDEVIEKYAGSGLSSISAMVSRVAADSSGKIAAPNSYHDLYRHSAYGDYHWDFVKGIDIPAIFEEFSGRPVIGKNSQPLMSFSPYGIAFEKGDKFYQRIKEYIPNFAPTFRNRFSNPLKSAQQREMMAGYNKSEVRIGKSLSLISPWNPKGLGVYNKDEGSLAKGISLAKQAGIDPKTKGMSAGHIPNFAIEDKTSDLINKQLSLSNLNFTITEKTNETKWLKEYIDQLQATITGIDIKADEIVKRKIKKLKYLNRKKIKETTNLILERNDLIEEIAYDQEDIAREKEIKKQESKIVKGRFQKFKEILGGKQDELSIQRRNELQSRALTASFLLPAAFGSIAGPQEDRSGFTKTLASIGESVGSGLSVAATLGFTPLGIAAGTVVTSFELLRKSSESANYSIDELSKSFDKRKTKNDQEIAAASSVIQSQDQLDNLISSGASSKKIAKAQLKLSQDISKISDIETFTLLSDPNVDSERKREALSELQERKAKENLALQGIEAIAKKSKEADEKIGMFFSDSDRLGMKLEREDFIPMIEAILGEIDPEKLNSEIGKTAIQGLNSGRIDIIDFFDRYGQELGMSEVTAKKASKEIAMLEYFYGNSTKEMTKYSKDFLTLQQSIDKTSNSAYNLSQKLNKGKLLTTAISDIFFSSNLAFRKSQIESASDIKIKDSSLSAMKEMGDITEREFINQKYQIAKEQSNLEFTGKEKNLVESITSDMLKTLKIDFEKITDTDKSLITSQIESVVSGKGDFDLLDLQKTLLKYSSVGESTQLLEELNSIQQKAANDIEALRSERLASDKTLFTEYSNNNKLLESFIKRNVTKSTLSGDMEKALEIIRTYDPAAEVKNFQKINKLQQKLLSPSISESERSKIEDEIFNIELEINKAKESLRDAQIITTGRSDIKLNEDFFRKRAYGQAAKAEASTLINAINKRRISTTDLGPLFSERETSDLLGKLSRGQFEDAFDAISIKRSQVSEVDKTISSLFDRLEFLGGSKEGFFMPNEEEKFAASVSEFSSSVSKFVEATLGKRGGAKNLLDKNEDETNVKRFRAALEEKQLKNLEIERQSILNARVNNNEKFLSPENIRSRAESQQRLDQEKILELQKELSEATKKTGKTNRKPEIIREEINFLKTKQYPTRSIGLEGYSQDPLSVIESEIKRIEAKTKILISSINPEYDKELQQLLDPKGKTRGFNLYSRSFTDTSGSIERQNQLTVDVKNLQKFLDDLKLAESKFSVNKDIAQFITDLQENLKLRSTTTPTGELKATQKEVEDSLKAVIEGFILLENPIKEILSKIGASIPNTPPSQASSSAKNNNISNEFASNTTININVNSNISGANQDPQLIAKQVSDVVIASATKVFEKMNREQKLGPLPPRSQLRANV